MITTMPTTVTLASRTGMKPIAKDPLDGVDVGIERIE